jgi:hypothetical protein
MSAPMDVDAPGGGSSSGGGDTAESEQAAQESSASASSSSSSALQVKSDVELGLAASEPADPASSPPPSPASGLGSVATPKTTEGALILAAVGMDDDDENGDGGLDEPAAEAAGDAASPAVASAVNTASTMPAGGPDSRVAVWNRVQQRKVAGTAAPRRAGLEAYLAQHPECEVFRGQVRSFHPLAPPPHALAAMRPPRVLC